MFVEYYRFVQFYYAAVIGIVCLETNYFTIYCKYMTNVILIVKFRYYTWFKFVHVKTKCQIIFKCILKSDIIATNPCSKGIKFSLPRFAVLMPDLLL